MLSDHLKHWRTLPGLTSHPVWKAAFEWIETKAATAGEGIYEIGVGKATVRVMEYATKTRDVARFESHRRTIDLQYTIEGAEGIEIMPTEQLEEVGDYDGSKDFQFHRTPPFSEGRIENVEGRFCILYPQDGHMPQLQVGTIPKVRKLVVKIPVDSVCA